MATPKALVSDDPVSDARNYLASVSKDVWTALPISEGSTRHLLYNSYGQVVKFDIRWIGVERGELSWRRKLDEQLARL